MPRIFDNIDQALLPALQVGKDCTPCLRITFHQAEGTDLCRVAVAPSPRPLFLAEGNEQNLYIRSGNSTRRLTTNEGIDYVKTRWKT